MVLLFTTTNHLGQQQDCSWWFTTLEFALDVLSHLVLKEKKIIQARIIDNEQDIHLSLEAFDGENMSFPIRQLEIEWQQLLGGSRDDKCYSFSQY